MPKLRLENFAISLDGYGALPDQDAEYPLGQIGRHPYRFAPHRAWGRADDRPHDRGQPSDPWLQQWFLASRRSTCAPWST